MSEELTESQKAKQWEKEYWKDFNDQCKQCIKECKQSWKVNLNCPKFEKQDLNK